MSWEIRTMQLEDVAGVVALQAACFPPPFDPGLHWRTEHIRAHLARFPEGQFVAVADDVVIASASNIRVSEETWQAHGSWLETTGGPGIEGHDPGGSTLYGLDIGVAPAWRGQGLARGLYAARFAYARANGLARYGTACRLPDYAQARDLGIQTYAQEVARGLRADRTMTPLLRFGLTFLTVLTNYMSDPESDDSAALLEWQP